MDIDPTARAAGVSLLVLDTVGSTNAEALARGRGRARAPLWIVARAQSAGRGRRGRTWVSAPGNFYATLLMYDPSPAKNAAQLSFVAALAVREAIAATAAPQGPRLALKWPNDVLCDGAKVAGILIEGEGAKPFTVAIGVGINCAHHPDNAEYPATDLGAAGIATTPDALFFALSATMLRRLRQWDAGRGFAAIRADWLAHAEGPGKEVRVRLLDREMTGRFEALDDFGRLVLRCPDGSAEIVTAGDVFPMNGHADATERA